MPPDTNGRAPNSPAHHTLKGETAITPAEFKHARHDLGLTQQAMADALAVTKRSVQMWEAGHRPVNGTAALLVGHLLKDD